MQSGSEYSNYLFRLWLMAGDIRNRKKQKFVTLRILEKRFIGLGGAAVCGPRCLPETNGRFKTCKSCIK